MDNRWGSLGTNIPGILRCIPWFSPCPCHSSPPTYNRWPLIHQLAIVISQHFRQLHEHPIVFVLTCTVYESKICVSALTWIGRKLQNYKGIKRMVTTLLKCQKTLLFFSGRSPQSEVTTCVKMRWKNKGKVELSRNVNQVLVCIIRVKRWIERIILKQRLI